MKLLLLRGRIQTRVQPSYEMNQIALSGITPPHPSDGAKSGQELLTLLRSLEKDPNNLDAMDRVVEVLQRLVEITSRRGLLQGDETVAEKVLATTSGSTLQAGQKRRGAKRGRDLTLQAADASAEQKHEQE